MPAPTQGILEEDFVFTIQTVDGNGEPIDADSAPSYDVYEDETGTAIDSGNLALLDPDNTDGFYSETLSLTTANGYERFKNYTIRIEATVSAVVIPIVFSFNAVGSADTFSATTGALTTLSNFQAYTGVTGDDDLITALIARATSAIEGICGRTLVSASFRELYDGSDYNDYSGGYVNYGSSGQELILNQYPVTAIEYIVTGTNQPLQITNTASGAYNAYLSVDDTNMTLVVQGGASASSSTITLASYTVSGLSAVINASHSSAGWSSSVADTTQSLWNATEIIPVQASECLNSFAEVKIPDEPSTSFNLYGVEGTIRFPAGIPSGYQNIIIRYTAGYVTTPAELEQICIDLTAFYYYNKSTNPAVRKEKLGDHTIEYGGSLKEIPDGIKDRLMPWRTLRF